MNVRELRPDEHAAWQLMRERLWPETAREELVEEQDVILSDADRNAVLVADMDGELVGFVEVAIREWAEGCMTRGVGYIEGWYVEPQVRRTGVGRALIEAAERWAAARGCTEMGSDVELPNIVSQQAHNALGYAEVVRLVAFAKKLS